MTDKAKAKWVKHAKKILPKIQKSQKLFLSGCGNIRNGVVDPKFFDIYDELREYRDQIEILPEDPDDFSITPEAKKEMMKTKIRSLKWLIGKQLYTRKYMVIQTGCDNFCTFCLTVQSRGRHKWRPQAEILNEIREFVDNGGKEVVFTGINLWAWGSESSNNYQDSRLVELIEAVLSETELQRLRISSLGVEFCSDALIELFQNPRINAYVHLSIQSWSSKILKAMNRHYNSETVRNVLQKFRNVKRIDGIELNIWADLIVGFPGETEEDYLNTENIVRDFSITQLHAFPFSPHVEHYSVPAGWFAEQVPNHIAQKRIKKLQALWKTVFREYTERNRGKELLVLIEKTDGTSFSGWSQNYLFCNEENFAKKDEGKKWERGDIIRGIYMKEGLHQKEE